MTAKTAGTSEASTRIARRMLVEGRISKELCEVALQQAALLGDRFEEALIACGVEESRLLKELAAMFGVQYVTSDRLAHAAIRPEVITTVPRKLAEQRRVAPVLLDDDASVLTVVTSDPDDLEVLDEVRVAAGVRSVRPLLARPAAVRAAVGRCYRNDRTAFSRIRGASSRLDETFARDPLAQMPRATAPRSLAEAALGRTRAEHGAGGAAIRHESLSMEDARGTAGERPARPAEPPPSHRAPAPPAAPASSPQSMKPPGDVDVLELAAVLVSLLEANDDELHGHAAYAARLARVLAERLRLDDRRTYAVELATLLHDVGKPSIYHLTPLNVAEHESHATAARRLFDAPVRMLEAARLPPLARTALLHMYERPDGQGLPRQLRADEIPIESRILAVADTYADLTANPRNLRHRVLTAKQASEVLHSACGSVLDENLVDLFCRIVLREELHKEIRTGRARVLIVDPDRQGAALLELRLLELGYQVDTVREAQEAIEAIRSSGPMDLIVSEVALRRGTGFELFEAVRKTQQQQPTAFVFLTHQADAGQVKKALELGADDYLVKPMAPQVVAAKLQRILEQKPTARNARGVSGSLEEMGLPELVQILTQGRKTGRLKISGVGGSGEIRFAAGEVWDARCGQLRGEDAFFALLSVRTGAFEIDPNAVSTERTIESRAEMLLIEGMRRLDEAARSRDPAANRNPNA